MSPGPNLDAIRTVERKRRTCKGCGRRRMTAELIPSRDPLCSECMEIRDQMVKGKEKT